MPVQQSYIQPRVGRLPADRPLIKLSVSLIDTYKHINTVYYEERDARRRNKEKKQGGAGGGGAAGTGANNNGWDDENFDYIITPGELFYGRYRIKERIGKGSFGQVVRAEDIESKREVAIKIIKSKKPFLKQAETEIELLTHLWEKDPEDQHNIGTLLLSSFARRASCCRRLMVFALSLFDWFSYTCQFFPIPFSSIQHSASVDSFHVS
jgi:dual specificity tyrosine-phosphorylation-regulated kinase 1